MTLEEVVDNFNGIIAFEGEVSNLEISKVLKKNGFNLPTYSYWLDKKLSFAEKGLKRVKLGRRRMNHNIYNGYIYSAPTKNQILKWLSKKTISL